MKTILSSDTNKPWVLIDLSYLAYRAMHTTGGLSHGGKMTGIAYGFFNQLRIICQDRNVQSNRVGIFIDSRHSYRKDAFPDYKKKRHAKRSPQDIAQISAMWKQIRVLVRDVLPAVGIPTYRQRGCESDDLLAIAARAIQLSGQRAIIVTADGDLFQCINHRIHWFDPGRGTYHTQQTFRQKKGIDASEWGAVKSLAGCHSDNVPGIPGIGEATAIKYLLGTIKVESKAWWKIVSPEGKVTRKRNIALVILPHLKTKPVVLKEPKFNKKAFFDFCKKFGLQSFLKDKNRWLSFFQDKSRLVIPRKIGEKRVES